MSHCRSHPAVLSHRQWLAIPNDEMIKHPHIDQRQRIAELAGQLPISLTRLSDA